VSDHAAVLPEVLVPYPGPQADGSVQDIFVYLRPETNGVLVESALLKVVQSCSQYRRGIRLVYLANFPGAYILDHHIVERHYSHKFYFAVHGKRAFTDKMKRVFEAHYGVGFADAEIIGSFQALTQFDVSPDELFSRWVPSSDVLRVDGQIIKRMDGVFVVNYDIPALLHKNTRNTDIAVMMFRCQVDYGYFEDLVAEMREVLVQKGLLPARLPTSRVFHHSRGPFDQVLDAVDYLCEPDGSSIGVDRLSFAAYAQRHGYDAAALMSLVENPICVFETDDGSLEEESIFTYTAMDSYATALEKMARLRAQLWIR
jgi:hypothetical protein